MNINYWFSIILLFIFGMAFSQSAKANDASLLLFPQIGTFTAGNNFEVSVFMNTGENNVNTAQVDLKFDPAKLQVISPTKGLSLFGEWIFPPSFSNTKGTISLVGGFPFDGINTSQGLITTIVFEAIASGKTEISFLDSSKVLVGREDGKDILKSTNRAVFDILPSPFQGPRIYSETHPDQSKWHKNNNPTFSWDKTENSQGYSYVLDDAPYGEPDNILDTGLNSVSFENIDDGIWYFHIKAKRDDVWGGTSHFTVKVDNTAPSEFYPYLEFLTLTPENSLVIYFKTLDALSGLSHYDARIVDFSDAENITTSAWIRQESPFRFSTEQKGVFELQIRAFDRAGNFQEGKIKLRIISPFLVLASQGIQLKWLFFVWWQIYIFVGITLFVILLLIWKLIQDKRQDLRIKLEKEIREAEKEIQDVREAEEKLRKLRMMEEKAGHEHKRLSETLEQELKKEAKSR